MDTGEGRFIALEGSINGNAIEEARDMLIVEKENENEDGGTCPDCGAPLKTKWSGVECTKCPYWFCF